MPARMARTAIVLSGCGLALGAKNQGVSAFLSSQSPIKLKASSKVPDWDEKKISDGKTYHKDYPKDERPADAMGERSWTHVNPPVPPAGPTPKTAEWYTAECKKINDHCTFIHGHRRKSVEEDLRFLEDEYLREKEVLEEKKDKHLQEKADVARINEEIAECKVTIKENAECPAELAEAKMKLERLQRVTDKSTADIERECEVEKEVIKWQKCVDELNAAKALLAKHQKDLPQEERQVKRAAKKIPDQEDVVKEAKARWYAAKANGVDPAGHSVESNCDKERDELMFEVNQNMKDLWRFYIEQKGILEGKEDTHRAEKRDVKEQRKDVAEATMKVAEAEAAVKAKAHCEPKLEAAEAKLAELVSVPDRTDRDIDEECEVEKEVIELKQCVKVLREAQRVLADNKATHTAETVDLANQEDQAIKARLAVPPQSKIVDDAYEAWLRAKALRDAANCYPEDE